MNKLNPEKISMTPQVTVIEVLLYIYLGSMNTCVISTSRNNVIHVDCKNDKTTLCLISEHGRIGSAWCEAKGTEKTTILYKPSARTLLEHVDSSSNKTYPACLVLNNISKRLVHKDLFLKITINQGVRNI